MTFILPVVIPYVGCVYLYLTVTGLTGITTRITSVRSGSELYTRSYEPNERPQLPATGSESLNNPTKCFHSANRPSRGSV